MSIFRCFFFVFRRGKTQDKPGDKGRVLGLLAVQGQLRAMHSGYMLHNSQPQACAAGLPGMAFIHPIKPLEHMRLMGLGDADAVIGYGADNASLGGRAVHCDLPPPAACI